MSAIDTDDLTRRLEPLLAAEFGLGAHATGLATMADGHAGLTFGFDVAGAGGELLKSYVLKLAPFGVVRRGNTDVYRQAPLLRALHQLGLPVPAVPWAAADEDLLGTPFIIMEKLPGRVFLLWEPHAQFSREPAAIATCWRQCAALLAQVHQVDVAAALPNWETPRGLAEELAIWPNVLKHAQDPAWLAAGTRLGEQLLAQLPKNPRIGLVHGDFQPGNVLFEAGRVSGLIDWEISLIGAQGLDLGWLLLFSDPQAWDAGFQPLVPVSQAAMIAAYRDAGGPAATDLHWFQAMAHYRMGAIACLNVKLHRTGKRHDPLWERFAPSIAPMFARGSALLA
jgi:aminoglycoside phosphotransferase (APT) family kinase protein